MSAPDLIRTLEQLKVGDLLQLKVPRDPQRRVIYLRSNDTLSKAIDVLSQYGIQSVLVKDAVANYWLGFVDVMDITTFILKIYCEDKSGMSYPDISWSKYTRDMEQLEYRGKKYGDTLLQDLVGYSKENYGDTVPFTLFVTISTNASVFSVLDCMFSRGFHRVPVYKHGADKNDISDILTQSDVINYLANNLDILGQLQYKTLDELKIGFRGEVASIGVRAPAIYALYVMYFNNVSSVAIIDDFGVMVAAMTPSDVKRIRANNLPKLLRPLTEFALNNPNHIVPPVVATPSTPLRTVITQMAMHRIHRVFIVDPKFKPVGVLSTTDIMRLIVSLHPSYSPTTERTDLVRKVTQLQAS